MGRMITKRARRWNPGSAALTLLAGLVVAVTAGLGCPARTVCPLPAAGGPFVDPEIQALTAADRDADLAYLLELLQTSYAHREEKERRFGVRARDLAAEVRPALLRAENRYAYMNAVDDLLVAFHDGHLTTRGYARTFAATYRPPTAPRPFARRPVPVLVGVGLEFRFVAGAVVISRVRAGSPAALAGLRPGDVVRMAGDVAALSRLGSSLRWRGWARLEAGVQFAASRLMSARPWYPDTPPVRERLVIERGGEVRTLTLVGAPEPEVEERDLGLTPARCGGAILRVGGFSGAPQRIRRRLDALLDQARTARFLVVDLRGNRGGGLGLALHLVRRLIAAPVIAGHHRYLRSPVLAKRVPIIPSLAADPADPRWTVWVPDPVAPVVSALRLPVAVLVDEVCASACEAAARALRAAPTATLYGEATAGSSGLPVNVPLPHSKLLVSLPSWQARTADGTLIEGNGVAPHVRVPRTLADLQAGRDAPLELALDDRCRAASPASPGSQPPR